MTPWLLILGGLVFVLGGCAAGPVPPTVPIAPTRSLATVSWPTPPLTPMIPTPGRAAVPGNAPVLVVLAEVTGVEPTISALTRGAVEQWR